MLVRVGDLFGASSRLQRRDSIATQSAAEMRTRHEARTPPASVDESFSRPT